MSDKSKTDVELLLGLDQPWSLPDVLTKLISSAEILLHEKNYDGHGWEEINVCVGRGKEIIETIRQLLAKE